MTNLAMLIFLAIVFGLYVIFVLTLCWGWASLAEESVPTDVFRKISVVVAFRNEERSLSTLINSLKQLNYPKDLVEFVMVDDHSEDKSVSIAEGLIAADNRFILISANAGSRGKKAALTLALARTTGELIAVTDADCTIPPNWLASINASFSRDSTQMVAGPVRLTERDWFAEIQAMEFASLIGATGATIALGMPTMCNAANMAFRRDAFYQVNGFAGSEEYSSGDDQFLMQKIATRWKRSVKFLHNDQAVVTARSSDTLSELIHQRLRWAGKWRRSAGGTSWLALGILSFHICNLVLLGAWFLGIISATAFIALAGARLFVEVIYLLPVCRFLNTRWRWSSFVLLQFFYPLYVVSIGCLSQILAARWKGREVSTGVWTGIS